MNAKIEGRVRSVMAVCRGMVAACLGLSLNAAGVFYVPVACASRSALSDEGLDEHDLLALVLRADGVAAG